MFPDAKTGLVARHRVRGIRAELTDQHGPIPYLMRGRKRQRDVRRRRSRVQDRDYLLFSALAQGRHDLAVGVRKRARRATARLK